MAAQTGITKTFIDISLTGGVNKKRDQHQLRNGELITAENVLYSTVDGQITKRPGFASINPQGAPLQGAPFTAIGCRDNIEPIVLGQNTLNRINTSQNLSTSIALPTQGRISVSQIAGSSGKQLTANPPSHAHSATDNQRYICVVWEEPSATQIVYQPTPNQVSGGPGNVWYGVQDILTSTWIIPPTQLTFQRTTFAPGSVTYTMTGMYAPMVTYDNGYFYISVIVGGMGYGGSGGTTPMYGYWFYTYGYPLTNLAAGPQINPYIITIEATLTLNVVSGYSLCSYDFHMANGRFIHAFQLATSNKLRVYTGTQANGVLTLVNGPIDYANVLSSVNGTGGRVACKCNGSTAYPFMVVALPTVLLIGINGNVTSNAASYNDAPSNLPATAITDPIDIMPITGLSSPGIGVTYQSVTIANNYDVTNTPGYTYIGVVLQGPYASGIAGAQVCKVQAPLGCKYMEVASRMFVTPAGKIAFWVSFGGSNNAETYNTCQLCEVTITQVGNSPVGSYQWVAKTMYLSTTPLHSGLSQSPSEVVRIPNTQKYVTMLSSVTEKASKLFGWGALNRVTFDYLPVRKPQVLPLPTGGNIIAGAIPMYYDGATVQEAGFALAPDYSRSSSALNVYASRDAFTVTSVSTQGIVGGANLVTASGYVEYYYVVCLVRRDAYGNVYRSAPSAVFTVPCPNAFNNVLFDPLYYNMPGNVGVEFYRSTQGQKGTYYFLQQVAFGQAFLDNINDNGPTYAGAGAINQNRTVYTNSNELPNDPPPACHHMAISESRAYMIPSDNRNVIWYSKQFSPGRSVEFCANLTLSEGLNSGQFTAVGVLDSSVIVFKEDQILYFQGSGPDNTGANGSFTPFQKIASDVGCIDPGSVCVIPDGMVFRSRRGIELLTRGLGVVYIGSNVEPIVQSMGTISSVVVMPGYTELRFVPSVAGQPVLCYDYGAKRWSTFTNMAAVMAASVAGDYWFISADGSLVNRETPGLFLDNGVPIVMTLETPEIPCGGAGIQGWGRVYRMALLGDFSALANPSAYALNIFFAYDHQAAYTDTTVFNTTNGLISGDTVYQFRCSRLPRQVMQTLKLKIQDTGVSGQACGISDLVLEVGDKSGLARLPAAKTV